MTDSHLLGLAAANNIKMVSEPVAQRLKPSVLMMMLSEP
jgi:hypothetical protein